MKSVDLHFLQDSKWKDTCEHTLGRNHFHVNQWVSIFWNILSELHIRTHTGKKSFCFQVWISIFTKLLYERDMKSHTGEKPLLSEVCGSTFSQNSHLKIRLKSRTRLKTLWSQWICTFWKIPFEKTYYISHWRETIFLWSLWSYVFTKFSFEITHTNTHCVEDIFVMFVDMYFFNL